MHANGKHAADLWLVTTTVSCLSPSYEICSVSWKTGQNDTFSCNLPAHITTQVSEPYTQPTSLCVLQAASSKRPAASCRGPPMSIKLVFNMAIAHATRSRHLTTFVHHHSEKTSQIFLDVMTAWYHLAHASYWQTVQVCPLRYVWTASFCHATAVSESSETTALLLTSFNEVVRIG